MNFDDYKALEAANVSNLKYMDESPLAYRYNIDNPKKPSGPMLLGNAIHAAILEPERFASEEFVVAPDWNKNSTKYKDWKAEQTGTILDADDHAACLAIRKAIYEHPLARPYMTGEGENEKTIEWIDKPTGIRCKGRLDRFIVRHDIPIIVEAKSTGTIAGFPFGRIANRLHYPRAAAHYRNGIRANYGYDTVRCVIVAVEQKAPHDVGIFEVAADHMDAGSIRVAEWLAKLQECRKTGIWHGRHREEQTLDIDTFGEATITYDNEE